MFTIRWSQIDMGDSIEMIEEHYTEYVTHYFISDCTGRDRRKHCEATDNLQSVVRYPNSW